MFFLGGIFAGFIRFELLTPQGDLVNSDTYNKFFLPRSSDGNTAIRRKSSRFQNLANTL